MPTDGAEVHIHGVYAEVLGRTDNPPRDIYGTYLEAITRHLNPPRDVYAVYLEVLSVVPKGPLTQPFRGWGIPL